jgi:hypothetical protein
MKRFLCALALLLAAACTSTSPPAPSSKPGNIDMKEARRMVGTENNVRVDAEIYGDEMMQGQSIAIKYDITNQRGEPILIADLIPQANYDPDTRTVTIEIGSEIPGEEFLPRLISVPSGSRRSFVGGAHINVAGSLQPLTPRPNALQLRINFLGDPRPFVKLIDIPEKAVRDKQLAAEIFPKWVEGNETVTTNSLPMRWKASPRPMTMEGTPSAQPPTITRRKPGT